MEKEIKIQKDGKIVQCDLLFRINDERRQIEYVVYTDNTKDINDNVNIYVSKCNGNRLEELNSNEDLNKIKEIIKIIQDEVLNNENK